MVLSAQPRWNGLPRNGLHDSPPRNDPLGSLLQAPGRVPLDASVGTQSMPTSDRALQIGHLGSAHSAQPPSTTSDQPFRKDPMDRPPSDRSPRIAPLGPDRPSGSVLSTQPPRLGPPAQCSRFDPLVSALQLGPRLRTRCNHPLTHECSSIACGRRLFKHPLTLSVHPLILSIHPLTLSDHPLTLSVHSLSPSVHPLTLSVHPLTLSVHSLSPSVHSLTLNYIPRHVSPPLSHISSCVFTCVQVSLHMCPYTRVTCPYVSVSTCPHIYRTFPHVPSHMRHTHLYVSSSMRHNKSRPISSLLPRHFRIFIRVVSCVFTHVFISVFKYGISGAPGPLGSAQ